MYFFKIVVAMGVLAPVSMHARHPAQFFSAVCAKKPIICELKPYAKIQNLRTTPSGRKVTRGEKRKKEEREKNAVNSGHYIS